VSDVKLVCPYSPDLLRRFIEKKLVVRLSDPLQIMDAALAVQQSGNKLHCIILESMAPLADIPCKEEWRGIPLAVKIPGLGDFVRFTKLLPLLRSLNIRIYLSLDNDNSLLDARIAASLGIPVALEFGMKEPDWEMLADLMTYAVLGRVTPSPIDPFNYLVTQFAPLKNIDFSVIYFDDPNEYLHLNSAGAVALTVKELEQSKFIEGFSDHPDATLLQSALESHYEKQSELFLKSAGCACCPAWRVCLGKFSDSFWGRGCQGFFEELMDTAEQYQALKNTGNRLWQP
jgi:hypothetical protein